MRYVADIKHKQWASCIELTAALQTLDTAAAIYIKNSAMCVGEKPQFAIVLHDAHFMVKRIRRRRTFNGEIPMEPRGGVENRTWSGPQPQQCHNPSTQVSQPQPSACLLTTESSRPARSQMAVDSQEDLPDWAVDHLRKKNPDKDFEVIIAPSFNSTIERLKLHPFQPPIVRELRSKVARILDVGEERISLLREGEAAHPLPDWMPTPTTTLISDAYDHMPAPFDIITALSEERGVELHIRIPIGSRHMQVIEKIPKIIGKNNNDVILSDYKGEPWLYPASRMKTSRVYVVLIPRGGMPRMPRGSRSRSRSISPTVPYFNDMVEQNQMEEQEVHDENDENEEWEAENEEDEAGEERPEETHPQVVRIEFPSLQGHLLMLLGSPCLPSLTLCHLPNLSFMKPLCIAMMINYIGGIFAAETARARTVVNDLESFMHLRCPLVILPGDAWLWGEVRALQLPRPSPLTCQSPYDMREGRWEYHQWTRYVPVIRSGQLECTVVIPRHLSLQQAQERMNSTIDVTEFRMVAAPMHEVWVICPLRLPQEVVEAIQERDVLRDLVRARGGIMDPEPDSEDDDPQSQVFTCIIPAMPKREVLVRLPIGHSVADGLDYVSQRYTVPRRDCVMTKAIPTVYFLEKMGAIVPPTSACRYCTFMIKWAGVEAEPQACYYLRTWNIAKLKKEHGPTQAGQGDLCLG